QVVNIREGYQRLESKVHRSLRTQQGDATHLAQRSEQVAQFLSAAEQHADLFSAAEFSTLRTNAAKMQASLEKAAEESTLGTKEPPPKVMQKVPNGKGTGRKRLAINREFLGDALTMRGSNGIASALGCSARTVRRRALDAGLVQRAPPVRQRLLQEDGTMAEIWSSTGPTISAISNDPNELDRQVADILTLL
ncbi:hypothetical protein GGX14DRAFT_318068, partial [Mycena pura]